MKWSMLKTNEQGLVPVVVQDAVSNRVLMLAYMNENAYEETKRSGEMVYYSRSRQERWKKGETSGNIQQLVSLAVDCDKDTILALVNQTGVACHTGSFSCFDDEKEALGLDIANSTELEKDPNDVLKRLETIIMDRKISPVEGSYTNYLFDQGIDKMLKKVGEETAEVIIAAKNDDKEEIIYETSDLMYHLMVMLNQQNVNWLEITSALSKRFPEE